MNEFRKTCPECDGRGEVEYEVPVYASNSNPYGYYTSKWDLCDVCEGRGEVIEEFDDNDE